MSDSTDDGLVGPRLWVTPDHVVAGQEFFVWGDGFPAHETVQVRDAGEPLEVGTDMLGWFGGARLQLGEVPIEVTASVNGAVVARIAVSPYVDGPTPEPAPEPVPPGELPADAVVPAPDPSLPPRPPGEPPPMVGSGEPAQG